MKISEAKVPEQSKVLNSAHQSNRITVVLFGIGVAAAIAWHYIPAQHKTVILTMGGIGISGGLTAIRFYNKAIEDGRFDIGDLDPDIVTRVMLGKEESVRLDQVRGFIEGSTKLEQLPLVKDAIASQAALARPNMHEQMAQLISSQKLEGIALPPIDMGEIHSRVLDPSWEAPV